MRFVSFPSGNAGAPVLVEPRTQDWEAYRERPHDLDADFNAYWKLTYGAFHPQIGATALTRAKNVLRCQDVLCIAWTRNKTEHLVELRKFHLFPMQQSPNGRRQWFPMVALVRTAIEIPPRKSAGGLFIYLCQTVESRVRQHTWISNPIGHLALKVEVKKAREALAENADRADWLSFVDEDYAQKVAWGIK